ncbi:uncharacterized protein [Dysidea avara]|uniref:uncharacterized protein n=1 Tax=Dysidea avara TaxID=196820 RepID=UPI00332DD136
MQSLWQRNIDWDEPLSDEDQQQWLTIAKNILEARHVQIPRQYFPTVGTPKQHDRLHIFAGASLTAYGAIAFLCSGNRPDCWQYYPTQDNPANLLTRGITSSQLKLSTLWKHGPQWLTSDDSWPTWNLSPTIEMQALAVTATSFSPSTTLQCSVAAYMYRFITNCKKQQQERENGPLTTSELHHALITWVNRKHSRKPYQIPDPPPLPQIRTCASVPFTITGIDFTGVLYVRNNHAKEKVYICLFTCATSRAIHLEVVTDLTVDTFLLAFRRFSSCRSLPQIIVSDNASTYLAAADELQ